MLDAIKRKAVAEECGWARHGELDTWDPEHSEVLWKALVHRCAELIAKKQQRLERENPDIYIYPIQDWEIFGLAIATNSTADLEGLVYELLTGEKA